MYAPRVLKKHKCLAEKHRHPILTPNIDGDYYYYRYFVNAFVRLLTILAHIIPPAQLLTQVHKTDSYILRTVPRVCSKVSK